VKFTKFGNAHTHASNLLFFLKSLIHLIATIQLHGRTRQQRYTKLADWDYVGECAKLQVGVPFFGNGDVISFEEYYERLRTGVDGVMIARGALIKPWLFTEIKERRHWDISSSERFDMLRRFCDYGLEHWGTDTEGVNKTRRFLLELMSFLHRCECLSFRCFFFFVCLFFPLQEDHLRDEYEFMGFTFFIFSALQLRSCGIARDDPSENHGTSAHGQGARRA
jgi:tRNA-dihydrouridine synthase